MENKNNKLVKQKGQSIVEFAMGSSIILVLLLAIPLLAKVGNVRLKTGQAADYVSWRVSKGVNTSNQDELAREVGQRFFSHTGADVLTNRNAECDDAADQDDDGNSIVSWRSVGVEVSPQSNQYGDGLSKANAYGKFGFDEGQYQIRVQVPVSLSNHIDEIADVTNSSEVGLMPNYLQIESSQGVISGNWADLKKDAFKKRINDSTPLIPYNTIQRPVVDFFNQIMAGVFPFENAIDPEIVKPEYLPADRLSTYK